MWLRFAADAAPRGAALHKRFAAELAPPSIVTNRTLFHRGGRRVGHGCTVSFGCPGTCTGITAVLVPVLYDMIAGTTTLDLSFCEAVTIEMKIELKAKGVKVNSWLDERGGLIPSRILVYR